MGDADTMLIEIQANLKTTLRRLGSVSEHALTPEHVSIEPEFSLLAPASGYLQRIDYAVLTQAVVDSRAVITFLRWPGDFVLEGSVLAVGSSDGSQLPLVASIELLHRAFTKGVVWDGSDRYTKIPSMPSHKILEIGLLAMSRRLTTPSQRYIALMRWPRACAIFCKHRCITSASRRSRASARVREEYAT